MSKRYYPLFLDVENERGLVVGEGRLADEKVEALARCGAQVELVGASDYRAELLDGVRVVVCASEDDEVGRRVHADAEARGILVNVLDRTHWCRFIAPAVVDRHPLQIAISTAGESPFLASALRRRLEALLPAEWSAFVSLVGRVRRDLRRRGVGLESQTAVYRGLLGGPVRTLLASGQEENAEIQAWKDAEQVLTAGGLGSATLAGAGPGDESLLTLAALEALAEADVVLHDALVSDRVLRFAGPQARLVPVGKRAGQPSTPQEDINRLLVEHARAGRRVVRLKGGDPFVFGRGGEELDSLVAAGIPVRLIPGVSSAVAAPAAAGIPLTMRGVAASVAFVTASGEAGARSDMTALARTVDTLVVLMGLTALDSVAAELAEVLGPEHPAAVISRATLPDQRAVRGTLRSIAGLSRAASLETPATLVVGRVVEAVGTGAVSAAS